MQASMALWGATTRSRTRPVAARTASSAAKSPGCAIASSSVLPRFPNGTRRCSRASGSGTSESTSGSSGSRGSAENGTPSWIARWAATVASSAKLRPTSTAPSGAWVRFCSARARASWSSLSTPASTNSWPSGTWRGRAASFGFGWVRGALAIAVEYPRRNRVESTSGVVTDVDAQAIADQPRAAGGEIAVVVGTVHLGHQLHLRSVAVADRDAPRGRAVEPGLALVAPDRGAVPGGAGGPAIEIGAFPAGGVGRLGGQVLDGGGEEADVDLVLAKRVHHHPHVRCGPRDARALQHRLAAGDRDGGEDGDDAQHGEHFHHGEASPHRAASRAIRAAAEPPRGTTAALNPLKPAPLAMTNLLPAGHAAKNHAQSGRELAATQAGLPEKSG